MSVPDPAAGLWAQAFLENAHGIAVSEAASGTLVAVNRAYAELADSAPEALRGRPFLAIFPDSEHPALLATLQTADLTGTAILQTCRAHREGYLIPLWVRIASLRDADGRLTHRVATVTDLRAQLRAEGQRLHAEVRRTTDERFRQLAESAPVGILLMDVDGACDYANAHWSQIAQLTHEQARGDGWFEAVHPDDRERVTEAWEGLMRGKALSLEFRYQHPGGATRWVHSRAEPQRDEGGDVTGYIVVDVDVTEQQQQRAAVDRFHARVRGLANRLESLREEERGQLAQKLHGTLRQEMTTLQSDLAALAGASRELAPASLKPVAELADRCLQHLRQIAFELQPPGIEDLGLEAAMKRIAAECAAQSGLAIQVSTDVAATTLGQRRSLAIYRTFQEGLANVMRHARASKVDAQVWVQDGLVRLRISDDGVGMGDQDRAKVGCFGLLAASERLAQLGGTLRVLGVAGKGTVLDVSLPVSQSRRLREARKL
ncbi:MAG: PAS domain S-box protein [Proteobacteria bacterium]|nr:PAS domain S-box protein [Pseudomonadota bacterium]